MEQLIKSSILKIGNVISVDGRFIKVNVDKTKNSSHLIYKGKTLKNVSVGGYVKITKGFERIIGKIEGEFIVEDKAFANKEYKDEKARVKRILNVSLFGFISAGKFERGIKELPLIDNECYLLNEFEFNLLHDFVKDEDIPIFLGHLAQEKGREIHLGINCLFASHIGIFGNTGSGKSYTLSKIYRQLFKQYGNSSSFQNNAKFFLIDFNGEYVNESDRENDNVIIERKLKNTFQLSTQKIIDRYPISSELINEATIWMILLEATEKTQTPFIRRTLDNKFLGGILESPEGIKDFIRSFIRAVTTHNDKSLEKNLLINFLKELKNATFGCTYPSITGQISENSLAFSPMGFWRHGNKEEFGGEEAAGAGSSLFSSPFTGLFLAGCSPALPASASPGGSKFVVL